jgi:hypothetical protein
MSTSVDTGLNPFNEFAFHGLPVSILTPLLLFMGRGSVFPGPLYALLQARYLSVAPICPMILMDSAS